MTNETHFEVSAEWMKTCGRGGTPKVFRILPDETRIAPCGDRFYSVIDDATGLRWVVWSIRGRLVEKGR